MSDQDHTQPLRERNRDLIAQRLHWPTNAADTCRQLETQHPNWTVYYTTGGLPHAPHPGYCAYPTGARATTPTTYAPTPTTLTDRINATEQHSRDTQTACA